MSHRWRCGDEERVVFWEPGGNRVRVGERTYEVRFSRSAGGRLDLLVDGRPLVAHVVKDGSRVLVHAAGRAYELARATGAARHHAGGIHDRALTAPMPGQVRAVLVTPGQEVARHETLVVLEAMKMELRIRAPLSGRVHRVGCRVGEVVERGQVLVEIEG
jgi:3-methylcrotonyl-CoA carboxylase alpha subunit